MPFLSLWIWWKRFFGLSMGLPFWIVHWVYRERGPKLFERIVEGWGVGIRVGSGRNWVRELRKDAWYIAVEKGLKGGSLEKRAGTGNTGRGRSGPPAPHPPPPPQTMALPLSMVLVGSQISGSFLPSQNGMWLFFTIVKGSAKQSNDCAKPVRNCCPWTVLGGSQPFVKEAHFCVAVSLASHRFSLSY